MTDQDDLRANRFTAIRALVLMRLRLFYREPGTMFWTFGFPVVMTLVLGIAFRNAKPDPIACAVVQGEGAPVLLQSLRAQPELSAEIFDKSAAQAALRAGRVSVVVAEGTPPTLQYDPTRPEGQRAFAAASDALERAQGRKDIVSPRAVLVSEPGARYIDFLVPGLMGLGLMSTGFWGIGFSLAEMRTKKLLKRLVATPMRKSDFLASFVLTRALLLVVELPPLLLFARLFFDVRVHGSYATLALLALLGGLTFAAMGLLLASRSENPQIVTGLINLASFPMYLCSGVFFSPDRFPKVLQPMIHALPLTALNDALRSTMSEGTSLGFVWRQITVLLVWGIASFALSIKLFRWR